MDDIALLQIDAQHPKQSCLMISSLDRRATLQFPSNDAPILDSFPKHSRVTGVSNVESLGVGSICVCRRSTNIMRIWNRSNDCHEVGCCTFQIETGRIQPRSPMCPHQEWPLSAYHHFFLHRYCWQQAKDGPYLFVLDLPAPAKKRGQ